MTLLKIAVAAPIDKILTYSIPDCLLQSKAVCQAVNLTGCRVLVPLGRRKVTGYVLGVGSSENKDFNIREVQDILDRTPLFYPEIISTFKWIAKYYHYPIGEVIKAALPGGMAPKSVKYLSANDINADQLNQFTDCVEAKGAEWLRTLKKKGKLSPAKTKEVMADKQSKRLIRVMLEGEMVSLEEEVTSDTVREKIETCYRADLAVPTTKREQSSDSELFRSYHNMLQDNLGCRLKLSEAKTLYYLSALSKDNPGKPIPKKELIACYSGASKAINQLINVGFVTEEKTRVFRSPLGEQLEFFPPPEELTPEQDEVLKRIRPAIRNRTYQPFLLHGVTGSGKTEVYLQAAEETLKQGRGVLVIVPEIALATQLEAHFVSRFGEQVVLLHSGLSASEKFDQWSMALEGKAKIVIGARSAIFAPLQDPGLIVVDEEHDAGLKQDDSLRYHGRDVAVVRAKFQNSTVLLSSATPSVVSYHNALTGKYSLLEMNKRVGDRPLPSVNIVDLRVKNPGTKKSLFSPALQTALKHNLNLGKQSVILINRRGFSTNVICKECGAPAQCKDCHVSLTYHKGKKKLLCHYCGYSIHHLTICEFCGSTSMVPVGFGSERVEEELNTLLPEAIVARLDTDTARNRLEYLKTLKEMRNGAIDVMVGTQMVAKGHHFPGVTLVGVVWADGGLNIPDFRAAERTFQLVTQVTGRAGRGDDPGEVFIQTMRPEHYAIQYARDHLYKDLVSRELELRKNPEFPPFVRVAAVHVQGESENDVQSGAARIAAACRAITTQHIKEVEILGPVPSPIDRVKRNYRWQIMVKGKSNDVLHALCSYIHTNKTDLVPGKCKVIVDVDPESMM